jgi:excisionase family DNA binding protein
MAEWIDIEQAAKHLGLGVRNLYSLAQDARIPASRLGKAWRFDRDQLDAWVRANRPLEDFFLSQHVEIDGNLLLRDAQREAYAAARDFYHGGAGRETIIQLPVGCGKSGLIALLPFGIARGRVLVIAPNLTIKNELSAVLDVANRQKCFWRKCRVVDGDALTAGPYLAVLDSDASNVHDCDRSHIVLANVQQLASSADRWLSKFAPDYFDLIIVDEAHHSAATSWQSVFDHFPNAKVVHLTATPFRSDNKELKGTPIYRYSFKRAMIRGYIKQLQARYVAPDEIYFTYDGDTHHHTLNEVLDLKEEEWFSRGVAMSPECNKNIVDASLDRLERVRESGSRHQLIAVAMSVNHARAIRSLYAERGFQVAVIHSDMSDEEKTEVLQQLRSGLLDCIVQVQMLGEGFDHPHLSVAAIFRPFRSLAPYIQFVGRIMRVIVQNDPRHPDNYGYIVTHVGMNLDTLLDDFRRLDREDQQFLNELLAGVEPPPPRDVLTGDATKRLRPEMVVHKEVVSEFLEEDFIDADDEILLKELREQAEALGFDAETLLAAARKAKEQRRAVAASEPFFVSPQRQRVEAQRRLNEEVKRAAKILLNRASLNAAGRDLSMRWFPGAVTGPNFAAAVQMLNKALDTELQIETGQRGSVSLEVLQAGMQVLPNVAERVSRQILARREQ